MKKNWIWDAIRCGIKTKTWKIMRLNAFFLFLFLSQVWAGTGYSQQTRLTLNMKNATVLEVLDEIENNSEFFFLFNQKLLDVKREVDVNVQDEIIATILNDLFSGTGVRYMVKDRLIILTTEKTFPAEQELVAMQQEERISGTVTDDSGIPLPGVTVLIKGTTRGTVTNGDGEYVLSGVPSDAVLVFSFVGMRSQEVEVGDQSSIDIVMESTSFGIEEVVAIGYGTQKKENLTSAVSVISSEPLSDRIVESPANLLYGLAAGVTVTAKTGIPGSSANIQIRESSTYKTEPLEESNNVIASQAPPIGEPLYVIDGIIRDAEAFSSLNPDDIEGITVLKDAASTSIYGIKGGNGVLLVSTKQGKAGETIINYTASTSTSKATKIPEYLNAYDYAIRENWIHRLSGRAEDYSGMHSPDELEYYKTHSYNAYDEIWEDPVTTKHNISLSGGNQDTKFFVSGSTMNNTGALEADYEKHTFIAKLDGKITENLGFALNVNGSKDRSKMPYAWFEHTSTIAGGLFRNLVAYPSIKPILINGLPVSADAAILTGDGGNNQKEVTDVTGKGEINYRLPWIDGLSVKGSYSYTTRNNYLRGWRQAPYSYNFKTAGDHGHLLTDELDYDGPNGWRTLDKQQMQRNSGERYGLQEEVSRFESHQSNLSLNYDNTFGRHNVGAFVGLEESAKGERSLYAVGNGFVDPSSDYLSASVGAQDPLKRSMGGKVVINSAIASFISRVDYNYYQKYIVGFTMRADRSYKFPKNNQVGYFPAVSLGWNIGKESFFAPLSGTLNALKLRGSYGLTGSDNTLAWQWQSSYLLAGGSYILGDGTPGRLTPGITPNNLITWEKNYNSNIGVDASFLNNLISLSVDYWNRKTTDILDTRDASIPITVGAKLPAVNYASGKAYGWEVHAEHNYQLGKLKYNVALNWASQNSEFLIKDQAATTRDYLNEIGQPMFGKITGYVDEGIIRTQEDLDRIYAEHGDDFRINGIRPRLGDLMFKDIRGQSGTENPDEPDGKITSDDREILTFNGKPKNNYGVNLRVEYEGFSLSAITQGAYNYMQMVNVGGHTGGPSKVWGDMWTPENINAESPIARKVGASLYKSSNEQASTFWLRDFSYLRMKSVSLSYRIPGNVFQATKIIRGIRLFASAENPFYIYNPNKQFDAEMGGNSFSYPIMKTFSGGINVTF